MAASLPDKPILPDSPARDGPNQSPGERRPRAELEEVDLWWGSYAGRAMLPGFLLCLLLTIFLLAMEWYLGRRQARSDLISSAVLGVAGASWLFEGTRWVYRMTALNYRLTNRRLLYMHGFKLPESWAIELRQITDVSVMSGPIERFLGVGRIVVQTGGDKPGSVVLEGVWHPYRIARIIRRRVRQARAGSP
ncbi:MAG TPA: PH domain-containing protein [Gemmataceae bacterium]|nr:PH domain-containing protein [Gemmataceae bacterium]